MLAKLFPKYVIAGVIQNSYYAKYMAIDLSKQIIGQTILPYEYKHPKHFYECNFFGYLSTLEKPTEFSNQFEAEKYDQAVEKFRVYNEVKEIYDHLSEFTREIREIFKEVEINNSSSNMISRASTTDGVWEDDLNNALDRYNQFLGKLEPYPEWHDKVVEEVGRWFHMIHNNLGESDTKRNIFLKMNRQEYFV